MKEELCRAFCNDIHVRKTAHGYALSTSFKKDDGDRIGFYVVDDENGAIHLEDDGTTIQSLEEAGVDFETDTRRKALEELLCSVDGYFDGDAATLKTRVFPRENLGVRALGFVGFLLRMNDFLLLTAEKAASTFREDAAAKIREAIGGRAEIREGEPVSDALGEVDADMVIEAQGRPPVAIFFGNSTSKVQDALFLQMAALHEAHVDLSVIALLETEHSVPPALRRRASNRLAAVTEFREDEDAAVARIAREAIGRVA
jgi:hypothetical protein